MRIVILLSFVTASISFTVTETKIFASFREWIKGKNLNEAGNVTNIEIAKYLNLPPVKLHCSLLASDAINAAIEDYTRKNKNEDI